MSEIFLPDRIGKTVFDMNVDMLEAIIEKYADMTHPQAGDLGKIVDNLLSEGAITKEDKQIIVYNVTEEGYKQDEIIKQLASLKKYCPEYRPYHLPRVTISNKTKGMIIGILLVTGIGSTLYYTYDDIATYLEKASKEREENKKEQVEMKKIETIDLMKANGYTQVTKGTYAKKMYQTLPTYFNGGGASKIVYINGNKIIFLYNGEYLLEKNDGKKYVLGYAEEQGILFMKFVEINAIPTIHMNEGGNYALGSEITTTPINGQEEILKNFF